MRNLFEIRVNLHHVMQAIVTVLAVINPMVCGSILLSLTPKMDRASQRRLASKASIGILLILGASALAGQTILHALGISVEVFEVVGGVIIAYMGFNMLSGGKAFRPQTSEGDQGGNVRLAPLMMFAAGPGTIAAVVTLAPTRPMARHPQQSLPPSWAQRLRSRPCCLQFKSAGVSGNRLKPGSLGSWVSSSHPWACNSFWGDLKRFC
jgi:small neutral amino acid transporter SnatA (MarC family)